VGSEIMAGRLSTKTIWEEISKLELTIISILLVIIFWLLMLKHPSNIDFFGLEIEFEPWKKEYKPHQPVIKHMEMDRFFTFYAPRPNEVRMPQILRDIVTEDLRKNPKSYTSLLKTWLRSRNPYKVWLAAEIIGRYKIEGFKPDLMRHFPNDMIGHIPPAILNTMWAYRELYDKNFLKSLLNLNQNKETILWIGFVYYQMNTGLETSNQGSIKALKKLVVDKKNIMSEMQKLRITKMIIEMEDENYESKGGSK
jgi:hypothetical protein